MAAPPRSGFSMIEALTAIAVTATAGGAILVSLAGNVNTSTHLAHAAVAQGLAEQLMDEIAAVRFPASSNTPPGGTGRTNFNDIDDYHNWSATPPQDRFGRVIGQEGYTAAGAASTRLPAMQPGSNPLAGLTQSVTVERVQPDSGTGWTVVSQHTNYRRVTVRITHTKAHGQSATLASITRIFSYVPVAP